jgi:hypothetical protein
VIGILMVTGNAANQALSTCLKYAPARAREEIPSPANINPAMFLPKGPMQYVRYAGSLTTPGCAEGVDWYGALFYMMIAYSRRCAPGGGGAAGSGGRGGLHCAFAFRESTRTRTPATASHQPIKYA